MMIAFALIFEESFICSRSHNTNIFTLDIAEILGRLSRGQRTFDSNRIIRTVGLISPNNDIAAERKHACGTSRIFERGNSIIASISLCDTAYVDTAERLKRNGSVRIIEFKF